MFFVIAVPKFTSNNILYPTADRVEITHVQSLLTSNRWRKGPNTNVSRFSAHMKTGNFFNFSVDRLSPTRLNYYCDDVLKSNRRNIFQIQSMEFSVPIQHSFLYSSTKFSDVFFDKKKWKMVFRLPSMFLFLFFKLKLDLKQYA